jgi:hypothetical protein
MLLFSSQDLIRVPTTPQTISKILLIIIGQMPKFLAVFKEEIPMTKAKEFLIVDTISKMD